METLEGQRRRRHRRRVGDRAGARPRVPRRGDEGRHRRRRGRSRSTTRAPSSAPSGRGHRRRHRRDRSGVGRPPRRRHVRSLRRVPRAVQQRRRRRAVVDDVGDHRERLALGARRQRDGRRPRHPGVRAAHDRGRANPVTSSTRRRATAASRRCRRRRCTPRARPRSRRSPSASRCSSSPKGTEPAGRHLLPVGRTAAHRPVDGGSQPTRRARPRAPARHRGDDDREARGDGEARRPRAEVPGSRRARAGRRRRHPRRALHHDDRGRVDRRRHDRATGCRRRPSSRASFPNSTRGCLG